MDKYGKTKNANETLLSQQKPQEKQSPSQPPSSGMIVFQGNDYNQHHGIGKKEE
jgi:hypothetical protein